MNNERIDFDEFEVAWNYSPDTLTESTGDVPAKVQERFPIHSREAEYSENSVRYLFQLLGDPTWETLVWSLSFVSDDGRADFEAIRAIVYSER
jgi:hypothetical protein